MNDFLKEKENLLNSIENNTSEHWKEYYKDVPLNCIFDDLVIDINEIKRLTEENQQLKEQLEASEKARKEAIEFLFIVYGISADYDGFNDVAGLKSVIDDMTRYVKKAKKVLDIDKGE